ncbi:MAG TPA: glutathione synthase [bacterium]|nr:glutathione synthase [bacterium]
MSRRRKQLKLLFIADPLERFDPVRETSLLLMREAAGRGHEIFATQPENLSARRRGLNAPIQKLKILGKAGAKDWHRILETKTRELRSFDAILLRKDPPFDQNYLHHLYLLDLLAREVYMMNHPRGILAGNEKILPLHFPELVPETLVSADFHALFDFAKRQKRGTVIKPLNSSGGRGVFLLRKPEAENFRVILEAATDNFSRHVVAQAFLPEVAKGDKRIVLLGGKSLGAFVRRPAKGEHRANLHAGGSAHKAKLEAGDRKILDTLQPMLRLMGLDFVGLDVIGDKLTEINVTSPMGLHEINATSGSRTETQVIDFIEEKI